MCESLCSVSHASNSLSALRRQGTWKGRQRNLDLNGDLAEAMLNPIATLWGPPSKGGILQQSKRETGRQNIQEGPRHRRFPQTMRVQFQELAEAASNSARLSITGAMAETRRKAEEMQRDLPRGVEPFIKMKMMNTYRTALRESGRGCVARQQVSIYYSS